MISDSILKPESLQDYVTLRLSDLELGKIIDRKYLGTFGEGHCGGRYLRARVFFGGDGAEGQIVRRCVFRQPSPKKFKIVTN